MAKPRIAITLGDPAGIGPEIAVKALRRAAVRGLAEFLVVGHRKVLEREGGLPRGVKLLEPGEFPGRLPARGKYSAASGEAGFSCVDAAVSLCLKGEADALVTAPICKAAWKLAGRHYPGHTEFLAERCGAEEFVMLLVGGGLRVALATIHEPLEAVPGLLDRKRIVATARVTDTGLRRFFGIRRPRLAVLGLNPHAGESGTIGTEERTVIAPAVAELRRGKVDARGPVPADTAFHHALQGKYDAVIAMYHDQGLAPLKTVAFDRGVNLTLGLPIIRTSPDHGAAFDIAGKDCANPESMRQAIALAAAMATRARKR